MTRLPSALLLLLAATGPAFAADPVSDDGAQDQTLVIARSVMPRIAYRGLEPTQNPVRVESIVFPGRVFHSTLDGLLGTLVGEDVLGDTASPGLTGRPERDPRADGLAAGGARDLMPTGRGATPNGASASIGGAVLRATGGLADTITAATLRATPGGGP